tara:strand:- start:6973 stop:9354 length:2382 start_codon:yes stop_codon:yes gene_type:complete
MSNSAVFDTNFYLTNNADVVVAISQGHFANALDHYTQFGGKELRAPNANFDPNYYAINNSDVLNAVSTGVFQSVFAHYQEFGESENRAPNTSLASFDAAGYLAANADVAAAVTAGTFSSALDHFIAFGQNENRTGSGVEAAVANGSTFTLTSGTDSGSSFVGGANNDTFNANLINESGVANITTLNNQDILDGGAGTDTLNATFDDNVAARISNIENFILSDSDGNTFNAINMSGVTNIEYTASGGNATISNLAAIPVFTLTNQAVNMDIDFVNSVVSGTSDSMTLNVSGNTDGDVTVEGMETINIVTSGGASTLDINDTGTTLATVNVSGTANLTLNDTTAMEAEVTTVNAADLTGTLTISTAMAAATHTVTGGSGNDTVNLGVGFTTADTVDLGAGTDKLTVGEDEAVAITAATTRLSNIEIIDVSEAIGGGDNVDLTNFTGATTLEISAGLAGSSTLTVANGNTVDMEGNTVGNLTIAVQGSGTSDVVNLTFDNADVATNVVATSVETLNITSSGAGATNTITGTTAINSLPGDQSIVIDGASAFTFTAAVTADAIDASALTGIFTLDAGTAGASTITGGSAADNIDTGEGQSNIVNGGAGADAIDFDIEVADVLTGGAGNDVFLMADDNDVTHVVTTITDLETGDDVDLDISTLEANTLGGAAITDLQDGNSGSVGAGNATFVTVSVDNQAINAGDIIVLGGKTYADAAAALTDVGTAGDRTFTLGAVLADNEGMILAYELASGGVELALVAQNGGVNTSSTFNAIDAFLFLEGVTNSSLSGFDIDFVA